MRLWILFVAFAAQLTAQSQPDAAVGRKIFEAQCALCHGQTGGGGRGPALNRPKLERAPDDKALRELISEGSGDMPGAWQLHPDEVASVAAYVRSLGALPQEIVPGDPQRGAAIYASKGCASCHMIAGQGAGFGPELTSVGGRRSVAFLRRTVLKPAASLPPEFLYVSVIPASGAAVRGIRINEDSFTIQLRDVAGTPYSFRKSDLKELRRLSGETPMPSYEGQISGEALNDLIAYLASLKGKP